MSEAIAAGRTALERACALAGIETSYRDVWGVRREVPESSLRTLLADFGDGADEWRRSEPPEAQRPCYLPEPLKNGGRIWGPAVQLYALRSQRNWGIGDFGDLLQLIEQWAGRGASVIGLSPLHALFPHDPGRASPYSPSSRLALNVLYIDVEAVEEMRAGAARALVKSAAFRQRLDRLREAELVDHAGVAAAKFAALALAYADFRELHLNGETGARDARSGNSSSAKASRCAAMRSFEALQERFHASDAMAWGWPAWPAEYREPDSAQCAEFCEQHLERVEYFEYLQWEAARQLERAVDRCKALGVADGLYLDLAVSVDRGGAEAWGNQQVLRPRHEHRRAARRLQPERPGLGPSRAAAPDARRHLHADAARSHALRRHRAHRPRHGPGAPVLHSSRRKCARRRVCALRRRPPAFDSCRRKPARPLHGDRRGPRHASGRISRAARALSVLSYRVLYFEREADGEFRAASAYPRAALATVSTHDLPTLAGWWAGRDLEWRERLALFPGAAQRKAQLEERAADRLRLARTLGVDAATVKPEAFSLAVHAHVAALERWS
jgi:(1->4)-alpha-D-glucan 1-alpha-D-glucosylmutase